MLHTRVSCFSQEHVVYFLWLIAWSGPPAAVMFVMSATALLGYFHFFLFISYFHFKNHSNNKLNKTNFQLISFNSMAYKISNLIISWFNPNKMTLLAVVLSASPGWVWPTAGHCTTAALIVLGIVTHLGVIGCTSKQVLSPSSHPLNP